MREGELVEVRGNEGWRSEGKCGVGKLGKVSVIWGSKEKVK